ncbi:MAG: hypothetical protein HRT89_22060, partial [Lentisphaeria bacterium]|nr:hypothetical protein [Lentisphaeria bacterium]NQZ70747.1 hypothetical protein [Lentisphaeria bacterium]
MQAVSIGEIPAVLKCPEGEGPWPLVIWLTGFSSDKESCFEYLEKLAGAGFIGLSIDPWQHGERMLADRDELCTRILSNIRRYFWPILANTGKEIPQVINW